MSVQSTGPTVLALLIGFAVLAMSTPGRSQPGPTVRLFQFRPDRLDVEAGTRLTWTNQDDIAHTVTSGAPDAPDGRFDVSLDGPGATGSVEFREPGIYPYFCRRHQSMRGEVRVQ